MRLLLSFLLACSDPITVPTLEEPARPPSAAQDEARSVDPAAPDPVAPDPVAPDRVAPDPSLVPAAGPTPSAPDALFDRRGPIPPAPLDRIERGVSCAEVRERHPAFVEFDDHTGMSAPAPGDPSARLEVLSGREHECEVGSLIVRVASARERAERAWGPPRTAPEGFGGEREIWMNASERWRASAEPDAIVFERIVVWADLLGGGDALGFAPRASIGKTAAELRALLGDREIRVQHSAQGIDRHTIDIPPIELEPFAAQLTFSTYRDRVYGASIVVELPTPEIGREFDAAVRAELGAPVATPAPRRTFYGGSPCVEVNRSDAQAEIWFGSRQLSLATGESPACGVIPD